MRSCHCQPPPSGPKIQEECFLGEVSAKPGDLERSDTFLVVMYRATALTAVTRWPVIFCQLFGQEGTQDLKSNRGVYNWKMSKW